MFQQGRIFSMMVLSNLISLTCNKLFTFCDFKEILVLWNGDSSYIVKKLIDSLIWFQTKSWKKSDC